MSKKVLIVDDSDVDRGVLAKAMEKAGYEVITASSASEGIAKARAQVPSLILMDVVMPGKSGFEACRELHGIEETMNIPIIICSTKGLKNDAAWGLRMGASAYIVKPVNPKDLMEAIAKL